MKKCIVFLLFLTLCLAFSASAEIDFSTMTDDDLTTMIDMARNEIYRRELVYHDDEIIVLDDYEGITFKLTSINTHDLDINNRITIGYIYINNSNSESSVFIDRCAVNGWECKNHGATTSDAGHKKKDQFILYANEAGLEEDEKAEEIEIVFSFKLNDSWQKLDKIIIHLDH